MRPPIHKRARRRQRPRIRTLQRPGQPRGGSAQVPTADDICRALEQSAAENALPVEFFARVIWQESRFESRGDDQAGIAKALGATCNAQAVSPKGAAGIAQFMPATASWHGLADPFEPVEALRHSAAYLRELLNRFGNLGLAAAAYNAGPAQQSTPATAIMPPRSFRKRSASRATMSRTTSSRRRGRTTASSAHGSLASGCRQPRDRFRQPRHQPPAWRPWNTSNSKCSNSSLRAASILSAASVISFASC